MQEKADKLTERIHSIELQLVQFNASLAEEVPQQEARIKTLETKVTKLDAKMVKYTAYISAVIAVVGVGFSFLKWYLANHPTP